MGQGFCAVFSFCLLFFVGSGDLFFRFFWSFL